MAKQAANLQDDYDGANTRHKAGDYRVGHQADIVTYAQKTK